MEIDSSHCFYLERNLYFKEIVSFIYGYITNYLKTTILLSITMSWVMNLGRVQVGDSSTLMLVLIEVFI